MLSTSTERADSQRAQPGAVIPRPPFQPFAITSSADGLLWPRKKRRDAVDDWLPRDPTPCLAEISPPIACQLSSKFRAARKLHTDESSPARTCIRPQQYGRQSLSAPWQEQ